MTTTTTTTATPTIQVYLTETGWVADFSQAANAAEMRAVLGTVHIPTPYTAEAEAVRAGLAAKNPGHIVIMDGGR